MPAKKISIVDRIAWAHLVFDPHRMQASYILRLRYAAPLTDPNAVTVLQLLESPPPGGLSNAQLDFVWATLTANGLMTDWERTLIPHKASLGAGLFDCNPQIWSLKSDDVHAWSVSVAEVVNSQKMDRHSAAIASAVFTTIVGERLRGATTEEIAATTIPPRRARSIPKSTSWEHTVRRRVTNLAEHGLVLNVGQTRFNQRGNEMDIYAVGYDPCAGKLTSRKGLVEQRDALLVENDVLRAALQSANIAPPKGNMKSIRADVDHNGRVALTFGYNKELVDLVKEVSGFSWDKPTGKWRGATHSLAALDFAARKRGDVTVFASYPVISAPPVVVQGALKLRDYQQWMAGILGLRREFLVCWSPRTGKTQTVIHAGATAIATRQVERVLVIPPAGVVSEWSKQLKVAFPGLALFEIEGTPVDGGRRKSTDTRLKEAVARVRKKACADAEKLFAAQWAAVSKVPPSKMQLEGAWPTADELTALEKKVKEKLGAQLGKVREQQEGMISQARAVPFIACQHDLVAPWEGLLESLATLGPFALAIDEIQAFTDERAPRSKALVRLAHHRNCRKVWATSGTPMRNRPEDLVVFFDVMGGVGSRKENGETAKWGFLKRYAGAHQGEYGWETGGDDNLDELAVRLGSVMHRLTREDVAKDLPPIDRKVSLVPLSRDEGLRYKALEASLGKLAMMGRGADANAALRTLVSSVLGVKLEAVLERVLFHVAQRGVKVLVGWNFHDSLKAFAELIEKKFPGSPFYIAGGWMPPEKRHAVVEAWKADPRPTPLLVNVLSSGVGIDLSAAEGSVIGEVPWVPSDAMQFEARILDVHQGTRTAPPWVEYVLAAGTVDEDMALAVLKKLGVVDQVVGSERESRGLAVALRESGVVAQVDLGLVDKSDSTVDAALEGLRRRLMGEGDVEGELSTASVVGAVEAAAEAYEDEELEDEDGIGADAG